MRRYVIILLLALALPACASGHAKKVAARGEAATSTTDATTTTVAPTTTTAAPATTSTAAAKAPPTTARPAARSATAPTMAPPATASPAPPPAAASPPPPSHPAPSNQTITISGFAFSPSTLTVGVGSTIKATNHDNTTHTWTADNGAWDSGNIGPMATSKTVTFNTPGTFGYHCNIHPSMKGSVSVQ